MYCYLYERKNKLEKILNPLLIELGIYPKSSIATIKNNNNQYTIENHSKLIKDKELEIIDNFPHSKKISLEVIEEPKKLILKEKR